MQAKEKLEKPLKSFVLPNESYKWDFILEKYVSEDGEQEAFNEKNEGLNILLMTALTRTKSSRTGAQLST